MLLVMFEAGTQVLDADGCSTGKVCSGKRAHLQGRILGSANNGQGAGGNLGQQASLYLWVASHSHISSTLPHYHSTCGWPHTRTSPPPPPHTHTSPQHATQHLSKPVATSGTGLSFPRCDISRNILTGLIPILFENAFANFSQLLGINVIAINSHFRNELCPQRRECGE